MMLLYRIAALLTIAVIVVVVEGAHNGDEQHHHRRRALGGASRHASQADCTKSMTIQLYKDDPSVILHFIPDKHVCNMAGPTSYVASSEDGICQLVLVSSSSSDGTSSAFAASVTCQDTGTVYSIGMDDTGAMMVTERNQDQYDEELESPDDEILAKERELLDARLAVAEDEEDYYHQDQGSLAMHDTHHRQLQSMVFDVLVLYTRNAECRNANMTRGCTRSSQSEVAMRDLINLAISETNTAFAMSMVMPYLNLIHVAYDPYIEDSKGTSAAALAALQGKNDTRLDNAHYLRQLYGADIVVLILDDPLSCGTAYVGPSKDYMFSVVSWSCATGHFIGRNLGCNYDRGATNACNRGGYAYGYRDPQAEFRTILSPYCAANQCTGNPLPAGAACTRILRFSSPYGMYNDKPYGDDGSDCVRRINTIGETVSSFFVRPAPTPPPTTRPTSCLGIGERLSSHGVLCFVKERNGMARDTSGLCCSGWCYMNAQGTSVCRERVTSAPSTSKPTGVPSTAKPTTCLGIGARLTNQGVMCSCGTPLCWGQDTSGLCCSGGCRINSNGVSVCQIYRANNNNNNKSGIAN